MALAHNSECKHRQPTETKIVEGKPVRFSDVCVYEFSLSDVDDPDLYSAEPLWHWQESDAGKWIMEHAAEKPYWVRHISHNTMGYQYRVMARLSEQNETFWRLKWGGTK